MEVKAAGSSTIFTLCYQTQWQYIQEHHNLGAYCHKNLTQRSSTQVVAKDAPTEHVFHELNKDVSILKFSNDTFS
jgi:hypothetical protein